eukprot:TRINITY_DN19900_c0_g1_i1.p1 TRINITY_DN19900_c0_g1~~TRINITY_DN19900_c0_g1_i1.p1  ORF type:complete len:813 (-),score=160.77 TRINITY_DN19900_c0_g1_i1:92-2530(-)
MPPKSRQEWAIWSKRKKAQSSAAGADSSAARAASGCRIEVGSEAESLLIVRAPAAASAGLQRLGAQRCKSQGSWRVAQERYADCRRVLQEHAGSVVQELPCWALLAGGKFLRQFAAARQLPKKSAQVLLRDDVRGEGQELPGLRAAETASLPRGTGWPTSLGDIRSSDGYSLLPYQVAGIQFGLENGGRVLLGDEMGLGKTVQALILALHYYSDWPLLVVCPSSLCQQWRDEVIAWLPTAAVGPGSEVFIVSYDLLARNPKFQRLPDGRKIRMIICDEAHFLKSAGAKRSQAVCPLVAGARRAILLTGTPAVNNAAELFTIVDSLLPGLIPSQDAFNKRYAEECKVPTRGRQIVIYKGSKRPEELHRLLRSTVMVRRLKADVLDQLPSKRRQRVRLNADQLDQSMMKEFARLKRTVGEKGKLEALAEALHQGEPVDGMADPHDDTMPSTEADVPPRTTPKNHLHLITELFSLTSQAKEKPVREYVQYLVHAGCRFLLFAHRLATLDYLEDELKKLAVKYIRIDGSVSVAHRAVRVEQFQKDNSVQVALLSITACGQGLNLQSASTVVFAEFYWVVGQMLQAEDRVHRVGQTNAVNVHYLLAPGTLDEEMYKILNRKHCDTTATLDGLKKVLELEYLEKGAVGAFNASSQRSAATDKEEFGESEAELEAASEVRPKATGRKQKGGSAVAEQDTLRREACTSLGESVRPIATPARRLRHADKQEGSGEAARRARDMLEKLRQRKSLASTSQPSRVAGGCMAGAADDAPEQPSKRRCTRFRNKGLLLEEPSAAAAAAAAATPSAASEEASEECVA